MQAATPVGPGNRRHGRISIPAAYAGCDSTSRRRPTTRPYFNPRSLCGLQPCLSAGRPLGTDFNPHSLCGLRRRLRGSSARRWHFNPRSLCGLRLPGPSLTGRCCLNFNPRSLCGLRPISVLRFHTGRTFQSPQPMRAATSILAFDSPVIRISIPAAYAGCDIVEGIGDACAWLFQSPQPMRAATDQGARVNARRIISIPAAYAGCDAVDGVRAGDGRISIPAAYAGCDAVPCTRFRAREISIPAAYAGCDELPI